MGEQRSTGASGRWQPAIWQASVHVFIVFALLAVFHSIVPRFAMNFEEFDLKLPAPTVLVVNMSNYLVHRWIVAVPIVLILLALDSAALACLRLIPSTGPILSTLWFVTGLAFLGLIILVTIAGLFLPLMMLTDELASA